MDWLNIGTDICRVTFRTCPPLLFTESGVLFKSQVENSSKHYNVAVNKRVCNQIITKFTSTWTTGTRLPQKTILPQIVQTRTLKRYAMWIVTSNKKKTAHFYIPVFFSNVTILNTKQLKMILYFSTYIIPHQQDNNNIQ